MPILKDRIRPLDPSSNQEFLEPDREVRAEAGSPQAPEAPKRMRRRRPVSCTP
jgi:hypothetical protein